MLLVQFLLVVATPQPKRKNVFSHLHSPVQSVSSATPQESSAGGKLITIIRLICLIEITIFDLALQRLKYLNVAFLVQMHYR